MKLLLLISQINKISLFTLSILYVLYFLFELFLMNISFMKIIAFLVACGYIVLHWKQKYGTD